MPGPAHAPSVPLAPREVRIHIDTLEYTRDGLRLRDELPLALDAHHRVVVVRPPPLAALAASHGGFPVDLSFPRPAVLSLLLFDHPGHVDAPFRGQQPFPGIYQIYAHADASGGDDHNKALTERRARVMESLLVGDPEPVIAIARQESWSTALQQVMLRALSCDPGPIDGKVGPLTTAAITQFQQRHGEGEYHRRSSRAPASLPASGALDAATVDALVEAYVVFHSPGVDRSRLHPTHPRNGCAAFNPVVPEGPANRRISLLVLPQLPPHSDNAPCVDADAMACPVPEGEPCLWFREHVRDAHPDEVAHHHLRPAWLPLANGDYLLSTLTTVPDEEELRFEVFAATDPVDGVIPPAPSVLAEPLGDVLTCKPIHGVAQVMWTPPEGFAPGDDGRIAREGDPRSAPVFRVTHERSGALIHDSWPAHDIVVLFDRRDVDQPYQAHHATQLELVEKDGGYRSRRPASEATPFDDVHYALRFEGVPPEGRYSLWLIYDDAPPRLLFEDVTYAELESDVPGDEPLHPPGWALPPEPPPPSDDDEIEDGDDRPDTDLDDDRSSRWLL